MSPLQIDINEEQPKIEVIPSKIVEIIALVQLLANREKHTFEQDFIYGLYKGLSERSIHFLDLISGLNFSGCDLFGFFMSEGIFTDFDLFLEKLSGFDGIDFVYRALDREISLERVREVMRDRRQFESFLGEVSTCLWKGNSKAMEELFYDTLSYKESLVGLLQEIYRNVEFDKKVSGLTGVYRQSAEDIRRRLLGKTPIDLAKEIKGWELSCKSSFREYYFFPSYFLHNHNIASWYDETFMLFYNIKFIEKVNNKEIDTVLPTIKTLSDRTRLQILQYLRKEPSYGKLLAEKLDLSSATICRHLDQLKSLNLIVEEKSDNYKYFKLNNEEIEEFISRLQGFFSSK